MNPEIETQSYTLRQIARILGHTTRNLYRLLKKNEIPGAYRIGITGHIRVNKSVFDNWLLNRMSNLNLNNKIVKSQDKG